VISPPRTSRARILDLVNGLRVMRHHLITPPRTIILLRYLGSAGLAPPIGYWRTTPTALRVARSGRA
jgi:hypothetical protein